MLENMTHLAGFTAFTNICTAKGKRIIQKLVALPDLLHIEVSIGRMIAWITLQRDGEGKYIGFQEMSTKMASDKAVLAVWGDHFRGVSHFY